MAGKFLQNFELYCALNATKANFSKIFARFARQADFEINFAKSWSGPMGAPPKSAFK
jgi:hypothetical protein